MKNVILILMFSLKSLCAQTFQFQMFFEDNIGNKDTLTMGYDLLASDSIETQFGENNILNEPFDTVFDVRITNAMKNNSIASYHTKKQITFENCQIGLFEIDIFCKNWPVKASWDSSLFNFDCKYYSLFTSLPPGHWFDIATPSNLGVVYLKDSKDVTFTSNIDTIYTGHSYINQNNDTIPAYWLGIIHIISRESKTEQSFGVYPSPVQDKLYIDLTANQIETVKITDLQGKTVFLADHTNVLQLNHLQSGLYILQIEKNDQTILYKKILKE